MSRSIEGNNRGKKKSIEDNSRKIRDNRKKSIEGSNNNITDNKKS